MRILTLLATLLFVVTTAFSQNIFIKYDETCMDRYEYQLGANKSGKGFITYHVKLDNGAKVILEVGPESIRNRKRLPKGVKTCKNAGFGQRMVDRINSKQLKVYLVRKDDKRYNFSPVGLAAYVQEAEGAISYRTKSYNFDYNLKKNTTGQDLANSASNSEVYLEGTSPYVCSSSYLFRKIPRLVCYAYTDIIYIPEIGIVEERTGRTVEEAEKNKLKLIAINGQPFEQYYANVVCPQPKPAEPAIVATPEPVEPTFVPTEFTDKTPTVSYGWIARNQPEVLTERTPQENAILLDKIGERRVEFVQADPEYGLIALAEEDEPIVYEFTEKTVTEAVVNPCAVAVESGKHIVQREETLYGISRLYGASVDQLRVWNKLGNQDLIYPCMQLYIIPPSTFNPTVAEKETPKGDCAESSFAGVHIVQKGETLYGIGRQYGLSISDLRKWNNLDNVNQLSPCMRIATAQPEQVLPVTNPIPNTAAEPITVTTAPSSAPTFDNLAAKGVEVPGVVVVKPGETLYQIARANGLNVNQLRQWNKLNSDTLTPGQVLYTTAPDTTPQPYDQVGSSRIDPGVKANAVLVQPGESLYQIAKDNNITVQNLRDWNNLTTDVLKAGQVLFITAPETTVITTTTANYVIVQKGQTLYQIAGDNGLTVANLRAWNNLQSDKLQPGQMIYIVAPTVVPQSFDQTVPLKTDKGVKITCLESSRPGVHVVQPGETLYEISRIHKITVQQLQGWNRLQAGDILEPCTKLVTIAPKSDVPQSYNTTVKRGKTAKCNKKSTQNLHIVQSGETLYQLSQKYNVRVAQLQAWNGLGRSTYLAPCTELAITQPASYVVNQSPKVATPPKVIQEPKVTTETTVQTKPRVPVIVAPQQTRTPIIAQEAAPPQVITKIICEQSSSPGTHIVQQGETLAQIAAIHRVTANQLRTWNNLRATDIIQACQALNTRPVTTSSPTEYNVVVVPTPQPAQDQLVTKTITTRRILHTVKKGETLGSIAAKYNITVVDLLNFNQLPNNTIIFIGQQLYASAPQAVDQITPPTPTTNTAANAQMPAGVQPDVPVSFDNSAQRINPTPAPAPTTTTVVPAEVFTSRSPEPATYETTVAGRKRVHVVQDGETIESIAKLYGVSPSRIRSENLLDERDIVIPLQKIYIVK